MFGCGGEKSWTLTPVVYCVASLGEQRGECSTTHQLVGLSRVLWKDLIWSQWCKYNILLFRYISCIVILISRI
jgi:hypothetical protein